MARVEHYANLQTDIDDLYDRIYQELQKEQYLIIGPVINARGMGTHYGVSLLQSMDPW